MIERSTAGEFGGDESFGALLVGAVSAAPLLSAFVALNLVTFAIYGWDKWCAQRGWRRVPEKTLLLLCAVGGAIGAWCAIQLFRHKTQKQSFRRPLYLATALNLVWLWVAYELWKS